MRLQCARLPMEAPGHAERLGDSRHHGHGVGMGNYRAQCCVPSEVVDVEGVGESDWGHSHGCAVARGRHGDSRLVPGEALYQTSHRVSRRLPLASTVREPLHEARG